MWFIFLLDHIIFYFASSKFEAIPDRMSPEAILAQARAAAKEAADSLTLRQPSTKVQPPQYSRLEKQTQDNHSKLNISM